MLNKLDLIRKQILYENKLLYVYSFLIKITLDLNNKMKDLRGLPKHLGQFPSSILA